MVPVSTHQNTTLTYVIMHGPKSTRPKTPIAYGVTQLRKHLGETQKEFAQRFGVATLTVQRWESTYPPTRDTLQRIYELAEKKKFPAAAIFRRELEEDHSAEKLFQRVAQISTPQSLRDVELETKRLWMMLLSLDETKVPLKNELLNSL